MDGSGDGAPKYPILLFAPCPQEKPALVEEMRLTLEHSKGSDEFRAALYRPRITVAG